MAGSVEHMAVAVELLREDQRQQGNFLKLKDPVHFVLGNLAPDGIMSRKGYVRFMKMHTHFRDGIPDWEFTRADHQEVFRQRIQSFCVQMLSDPALDRDLYLGYVTHILTDEIFMKTIRQEFMEKIAAIGLTDRDAETFEHFTYDVNQIDFRLGREYPGIKRAEDCLRCEDPCSILEMVDPERKTDPDAEKQELEKVADLNVVKQDPEKVADSDIVGLHMERKADPVAAKQEERPAMITSEELADSREWVRNFFFDQAPAPQKPVYYTYDRAVEFIGEAAAFIKQKLPEYI
ncbi:zinc dependent phospholipase C family protein [Jutongia sp.]